MSESVNVTLLPGVTALGEALRPLLLKLQAQVDAPVRRHLRVVDLVSEIADHLDELKDTLQGLEAKANALDELLAREGPEEPVAGIHRVVGGLEVYLDTLLERYSEVRRWRPPGASGAVARDSLAGVYRHLLTEIRDWMDELIEAIDDPLAAVKRRGLPTSGKVNLEINLILTEAPELASLHDWLDMAMAKKAERYLESLEPLFPPWVTPPWIPPRSWSSFFWDCFKILGGGIAVLWGVPLLLILILITIIW